jgi:hypothetical protein
MELRVPSMLRRGAILALLGALACAQDDPDRGRLLGSVQDGARKRVAGAEVTLLSWPLPPRTDVGQLDRVQVTTDGQGTFRAELLHGRAYSAFACWRDAGGAHRTQVAEGVIPGPPRGLEEAPPQSLRRVRFRGAAAWQEHAPLHFYAIAELDNPLVVELTADAETTAALPDLPGDHWSIEVRARDGLVLAMWLDGALQSGGAEVALELPPPRTLRVEVVDETGAAIAGARVQHYLAYQWRNLMHELGRTDKAGALAADVPSRNAVYGADNQTCIVLVEADGRQRVDCCVDFAKLKGALQVTLRPGIELRGRLLAKDGAPVHGVTLLPESYTVGSDAETSGFGVWPLPLLPQPDGTFRFHSLHPHYDFRLLMLVAPATARELGLRVRPGFALAPVLWLAVGDPPAQTPLDLGDLKFDALTVARIEVKTATGEPVPGARLCVTTKSLYNSPMQYTCDRVGRLQFTLPEGEIRIGAWAPGGGVATAVVRVPPATGEALPDPLLLQLSATRTVRGIVVDQDGKPVAGAKVRQWDRAKQVDRQLAELTFHGRAVSEPTGADGRFALTLPMAEATFGLRATAASGGRIFWSDEILVAPDDTGGVQLRLLPFK